LTKEEALPIIATAAVASEKHTGLPAEITAAQCALESGWLRFSPKNNCFGIKHAARHTEKQLLQTREFFDTAEHAYAWVSRLAGREIISETGRIVNGRREFKVRDWFAAYPALADCFADHARLITSGKPYRTAWGSFIAHHSWERLLRDIAPIYATAPTYEAIVLSVLSNGLRDAIQRSRTTERI
jgi:flagellum-specific peptidoglycan hydrolase FlgJ